MQLQSIGLEGECVCVHVCTCVFAVFVVSGFMNVCVCMLCTYVFMWAHVHTWYLSGCTVYEYVCVCVCVVCTCMSICGVVYACTI